MPQVGERQTRDGVTGEWDGIGWKPVDAATTQNQPDSYWAGFTRHLLEKEPAARNALLSVPALAGGPVTAMATPFVGRGLEKLSEFFGTGKTDLPTAGEMVSDVTEGVVGAYGGPMLAKGAKAVRTGKDAITGGLPKWLRAGLHTATAGSAMINPTGLALDVATSKPVTTAAEALGEGLSPSTPEAFRRSASSVLKGLKPGVDEDALLESAHRSRVMASGHTGSKELPYRGGSGVSDAGNLSSDALRPPPAGPAPRLVKGNRPSLESELNSSLQALRTSSGVPTKSSLPPQANPVATADSAETIARRGVQANAARRFAGFDIPEDRLVPRMSPNILNSSLPAGGLDTVTPVEMGKLRPSQVGLRRSISNDLEDVVDIPEFTAQGSSTGVPGDIGAPGLSVDLRGLDEPLPELLSDQIDAFAIEDWLQRELEGTQRVRSHDLKSAEFGR